MTDIVKFACSPNICCPQIYTIYKAGDSYRAVDNVKCYIDNGYNKVLVVRGGGGTFSIKNKWTLMDLIHWGFFSGKFCDVDGRVSYIGLRGIKELQRILHPLTAGIFAEIYW